MAASSRARPWFADWTGWRIAVWISMPVCWFVQAASYRHVATPDGINYLDMAAAFTKGNWGALVNGYWSPLYPFLLSIWLRLTNPSPYREVESVLFLNCLLLMLTLLLFEYFLRCLQEFAESAPRGSAEEKSVPFGLLKAIGYTLFFWMSLYLLPPNTMTPDVLVWALVLATGACLLRIQSGKNSWAAFAALGVSLGAGYLAKAFMLPAAFFVFGLSGIYLGRRRQNLPKLLLAAVIVSLMAAPLILSLSKQKGRFTVGDTGRINYAEFVNGVVYFSHWQGGPPGAGTPLHPTRKLLDAPPVYEYAFPVGGTYPVGYDVSYWYDGVRPHFELRGQLSALRKCLDSYFEIFVELGAVVAGFLALLYWMQHFRLFLRNFLALGFLWGPCVAALFLYALVHVEWRFLPGFLLLIAMSLFLSLRLPQGNGQLEYVRAVVVGAVVTLSIQIAWGVGHGGARLATASAYPEWAIAEALHRGGVAPGERIAFIGSMWNQPFWAHLAGVTFVAEIPAEGTDAFLFASPEIKAHVFHLFKQAGAKAVVTRSLPPEALSNGWRPLGDTGYHVFLLDGQ